MHPTLSTYKLLGLRAQSIDNGEDWIDWAMELIEKGYEGEYLYILAGLNAPFGSYEDDIVVRTLREQEIAIGTNEQVLQGYAWYLINSVLDRALEPFTALRELRNLCQKMAMPQDLLPFYLLYFAWDDLCSGFEQFYWNGATKENIESIVREECLRWKNGVGSNFT